MTQTQWTPEVQAMWAKLERFQFDNSTDITSAAAQSGATAAGARLPKAEAFVTRLAKENGWTLPFSSRVAQEYKRFLLLAAHAGHTVTPSESIDQAWHLHLVFTRSYWQRLCGEILGRPLHHDPGVGQAGEEAKFQAQYLRTLESYRRFFGAEAPADIWPCGPALAPPAMHRWVDVSRHWMLPKPCWLHVARRVLGSRHWLPAAAAVVVVSFLAGCRDLGPLDVKGGEFLRLYIGSFVLAFIASLAIMRERRGSNGRTVPHAAESTLSDPYEIALLGGGPRRLADALLASLHSHGLLQLDHRVKGQATVGVRAEAGPRAAKLKHSLEQQAWEIMSKSGQLDVRRLRQALQPLADMTRDSLVQRGLMLAPARYNLSIGLASLPLVLVMVFGLAKVCIGLDRGKPVFLLVLCLITSLVVLILRRRWASRRTVAGNRVWRQLRRRRRVNPVAQTSGGPALDPDFTALAVALDGNHVLANPASQPLHDAIHRTSHTTSSGCSAGGCSGGSCGSSSCGGGGCGGCGGGGD